MGKKGNTQRGRKQADRAAPSVATRTRGAGRRSVVTSLAASSAVRPASSAVRPRRRSVRLHQHGDGAAMAGGSGSDGGSDSDTDGGGQHHRGGNVGEAREDGGIGEGGEAGEQDGGPEPPAQQRKLFIMF